jgi:Uncharacterized conserved protein
MWNRKWRNQINSGKALEEYTQKASEYVGNSTLLDRLLEQVQKYLGETVARRVSGVAALVRDIPLLIRMAKAWLNGSYRQMGYKNMIIIVAGLLYFLSPFDLIPDFLGAIGFLDDIAILGMILSRLQREIEEFRKWESVRG